MPNNADFSGLEIQYIEIQPDGWIPLIIEYGIKNDAFPIYYWRVKGTKHTFTIPVSRLDFISSGDYATHFKEALEGFREDYLNWSREGFITEWSREYRNQYAKYIVI